MKITVEICSVEELVAIFAVIRGEVLDEEKIAQLTKLLSTSTDALKQAVDAAPQAP